MIYSQLRQFPRRSGEAADTRHLLDDNNIKDMQNFSFKGQTLELLLRLPRLSRQAHAVVVGLGSGRNASVLSSCFFSTCFTYSRWDGSAQRGAAAMMLLDES